MKKNHLPIEREVVNIKEKEVVKYIQSGDVINGDVTVYGNLTIKGNLNVKGEISIYK